jgi:hypothetical protein
MLASLPDTLELRFTERCTSMESLVVRVFRELDKLTGEYRYIVKDGKGRKLGDYGDRKAAIERAQKIERDLRFPL